MELRALCQHLGQKAASRGGWMEGALANLRALAPDLQLGIASMHSGARLEHYSLDGLDFYRIPYHSRKRCDDRSLPFFQELYRSFKPDVIHVHGTEYPHSLTAAECANGIPVVASLQGIINACQSYALGGLSPLTLLRNTTLRDIVRFNLPTAISGDMKRRAALEKKTLQLVSHVIGRTNWDHAHVLHLHPRLNYHFCNETLQNDFYTDSIWNYDSCTKHCIFASNSSIPLKGIHQLIRAVALLREKYPNVQLAIAGEDILRKRDWKSVLMRTGYSHYLRKLIFELGVQNNISFTGVLSAEQMKEQFLRCNVYVLPSAIENSSNTLGEAQLLGVPVVASEVGGVLSMVEHGKSGLVYRYEDPVQLAYWIGRVFDDPVLANRLGENGRVAASARHDRAENARTLLQIYQEIAGNDGNR